MSKRTLFKSNIFPVCDKLMKKGVRPTIQSVRSESGINTGSNSTLQALIAQWYQERDSTDIASVHISSLSSDLPEELVRLTESLYAGILEESKRRLSHEIESLKQDREWVVSEMYKLSETRQEMELHRQSAQEMIDQLKADLLIYKNELQQAHFVISSIKDEKDDLYRQHEKLKSDLHLSKVKADAQIQRLTDQVTVANSFLRMTEESKRAETELLTLQMGSLKQTLDNLVSQIAELGSDKQLNKTPHLKKKVEAILDMANINEVKKSE